MKYINSITVSPTGEIINTTSDSYNAFDSVSGWDVINFGRIGVGVYWDGEDTLSNLSPKLDEYKCNSAQKDAILTHFIKVIDFVINNVYSDYFNNYDYKDLRGHVAYTTISNDMLSYLSKDDNNYVRNCVALNKNTSIEVLQYLINDKDYYIRGQIARHPNTTYDMMHELSKDNNGYIHQCLVSNPNVYFHMLKEDTSVDLRVRIAQNPLTPIAVLETLSKDKDIHVLYTVAKNNNTPEHILNDFAQSDMVEICRAVASNWYTPVDTLKQLMNHENTYVKFCAERTLKAIGNK